MSAVCFYSQCSFEWDTKVNAFRPAAKVVRLVNGSATSHFTRVFPGEFKAPEDALVAARRLTARRLARVLLPTTNCHVIR